MRLQIRDDIRDHIIKSKKITSTVNVKAKNIVVLVIRALKAPLEYKASRKVKIYKNTVKRYFYKTGIPTIQYFQVSIVTIYVFTVMDLGN